MLLIDYCRREYGNAARLADLIGVHPILISQWANSKDGRKVPLDKCVPIEIATEGKVTCEEMRPDMSGFFRYLRTTAKPRASPAQRRAAAA